MVTRLAAVGKRRRSSLALFVPIFLSTAANAAGPAPVTGAALPASNSVAIGAATATAISVSGAQGPRASQADELAELQATIPLLKARAEIAKLNAEIATAAAAAAHAGSSASQAPVLPAVTPIAPQIGAGDMPGAPPGPASTIAPQRTTRSSMRTVAISGFDGQYHAVVEAGGRTAYVQPGDSVEGGWTVVSINEFSVKLRRGREVISLGL